MSDILNAIAKNNNVNLLEEFLKNNGYDFTLKIDSFGDNILVVFAHNTRSIKSVLSTKLTALIILFYWNMMIRSELKECSLMIVDNFHRTLDPLHLQSELSHATQHFNIN